MNPFGTFHELIEERGFERCQPALVSRWKAHCIDYSVTYGKKTAKSCLWMDYAVEGGVGRVTVWVSGEAYFEVRATDGRDVLRETHLFRDTKDFHMTYSRVPLMLMKLRGDDLVSLTINLPDV